MHRFLVFTICTTIAGCAADPSRPIPLHLDIEVAADANPDDSGRPSPVVLSVFDLAKPARFGRSNYLTLLSMPKKCLSSDFLGQHRTQAIAPGTRRTVTLTAEPESRHIGIVAELVQFSETRTRIDVPLRARDSNNIRLHIDSEGITLLASERPAFTVHSRFNDD